MKLLLPLTTKRKSLLLRFDLTGPAGRPVHLLQRHSIAAIQAEYVSFVSRSSPATTASALLDHDLMTAI